MRVLVIGSGIAGLVAAVLANQKGYDVTLITKTSEPTASNSNWAQGGIAYKGKGDSSKLFAKDVMNAAAGMANPDAVKLICEAGPAVLEEILIDLVGVPFERHQNSASYRLIAEGAHSVKRIMFSGDQTGQVIVAALIDYIKKKTNIRIISDHTAVDLITIPHHSSDPLSVYCHSFCLGAYLLNNKTREIKKKIADRIILATGGLGRIYKYHTNPPSATGDGIGLAYRAGARIVNLEFTQFHPTTLAVKGAHNFLITEAIRGEGGILINARGEDFTKKYHRRGSLAPRDIVSKSIIEELERTGEDLVYLSLEKISSKKIKARFPRVYTICKEHKIDITKEPIPVLPAFHFSCGGVLTDLRGHTSLPNLYAIGETACTGVHGANRLASTSLLECLVMAKQSVFADRSRNVDIRRYEKSIKAWEKTYRENFLDPVLIKQDWANLTSTMWHYVGIVRKTKRMSRAFHHLRDLLREVNDFYRHVKVDKRLLELRNAIQTGVLVTSAALKNKKSMGCHFRVD